MCFLYLDAVAAVAAVWLAFTVTAVCRTVAAPLLPPTAATAVASTEASSDLDAAAESISALP